MYPWPINSKPIFGQFNITLYGICIAIGILACFGVFFYYTKKRNISQRVQDFAFFTAVVSIAVGFLFAKLFQAVYNWIESGVFNFYSSGITVMGGLIGGAGTFLLVYFVAGNFMFTGKEKGLHVKEFNKIFSVAPCCITIAHAFGRLGCLSAGCCQGKFLSTNYVFGGVFLQKKATINGTTFGVVSKSGYYVPTQLYEALFLFALFGVLTFLYFKRYNIIMHVYLIAYGVWRIFIEFFRHDHVGELFGILSPSQWQSIFFILGGVALFLVYKYLKKPFILPKDGEEKSIKKKK